MPRRSLAKAIGAIHHLPVIDLGILRSLGKVGVLASKPLKFCGFVEMWVAPIELEPPFGAGTAKMGGIYWQVGKDEPIGAIHHLLGTNWEFCAALATWGL